MFKSTAGGQRVQGYDRQKTSTGGSTDTTPFCKPWLSYAPPVPAQPSVGAACSMGVKERVREALCNATS